MNRETLIRTVRLANQMHYAPRLWRGLPPRSPRQSPLRINSHPLFTTDGFMLSIAKMRLEVRFAWAVAKQTQSTSRGTKLDNCIVLPHNRN
jgi:hypothetical protein